MREAYGRTLASYRSRPRLLLLVLLAVTALNVADLLLTLRALELGAVELNPVMAGMFETSLPLAATFKVGGGIAVVVAMWAMRRYRLILEASLVLLSGFVLLTTYSVTSLLAAG